MKLFVQALLFLGILCVIGWVLFAWRNSVDSTIVLESPPLEETRLETDETDGSIASAQEGVPEPVATVKNLPPQPEQIRYTVPFVSQAPTGEWTKSEFQNGCEEASVLMVSAWQTGKTYTKDTAKAELVAMARYQEKKIGQGIDTDAADTAVVLLKGYFDIADYQLVYDFTLDDLKHALAQGPIIVPTNGRALKNPNFTLPGPLQHMLVIIGYDATTEEFITNDPGTRKGEAYRYPAATLYGAVREYPTGKHLSIKSERKAMIVVPTSSLP